MKLSILLAAMLFVAYAARNGNAQNQDVLLTPKAIRFAYFDTNAL